MSVPLTQHDKLITCTMPMVPTRPGKPGKTGVHFPVREESRNFTVTGKIRKIYPKYWKNQEKLHWKIEKNYW